MPKITARTVVLTALFAVALTGCAGTAETAPSEPQDAPASQVSETPAPLVAGTASPRSIDDAETDFIERARDQLSRIHTQIPDATDEQLLVVGYAACERIEEGITGEAWSGIEGETMTNGYYMDSNAIATAAVLTLCPDA